MHIYLLAAYLVKVLENQQFKIFVLVFLLITENNIDEKAYRQMIFKKTMDKQSLTLLLPFHNSYKTSFFTIYGPVCSLSMFIIRSFTYI